MFDIMKKPVYSPEPTGKNANSYFWKCIDV